MLVRRFAPPFLAAAALAVGAGGTVASRHVPVRPEPPAPTPTPAPLDPAARKAVSHLNSARLFATGGVGFAGQTTPETKTFLALLKHPQGAAAFRRLLAAETVEGRMYGLVGLWVVAPGAFDRAYASVRDAKEKGRTASGCLMGDETLGGVAGRAKRGDFQHLRVREATAAP